MTESVTATPLPFGAWPSPIAAADVAKGQLLLSFPIAADGGVWWQEGLPDEGGRVTVAYRGPDGPRRALLPAPWNARTRVHEYGGLSYLPVPVPDNAEPGEAGTAGAGTAGPAFVFANYSDQRLYLAVTGPAAAPPATGADGDAEPPAGTADAAGPAADAAGNAGPAAGDAGPAAGDAAAAAGERVALRAEAGPPPRPLTPVPEGQPGSWRYADFALSPDGHEVWCVQERHAAGKVTRAIVAVPLDGSAADDASAIRELVTGWDFYAFPTPSPDGSRLAWICWNHPRMPWDGTELRSAVIEDGVPGKGRLVKGGMRESVLAPVWRDDTSLYVISDWPGWWNLYQVGLLGEPAQALFPADEEFADPLWQLGQRPFAVLGDGRLAVLHGSGGMGLGLLDPESGEITDPGIPFPFFASGLSADGMTVVGVAGGPAAPLSVIRFDVESGQTEVLRSETDEIPAAGYLPVPRHEQLEGKFGRSVHALVYPPSHPEVTGPEDELPPYVVWVHGGPTSHSVGLLDLEKAYFTSRGIGVIDVNYGGSTGYGRSYRERLRMQWGVIDVEDAAAAALALAEAGEADRGRLAIRGGSAGGWTALAAVTTGSAFGPVFAAATSYYGVADLREFAAHTHDFESHYLDGLLGPLPGFEAVYAERSPAGHVTGQTCPVLLLQGLDDPVVPPAQAESIAESLTAHGIRHALLTFEGESHGFRRTETIITSLEAELSFYGQVLGFTPPGIPALALAEPSPAAPSEATEGGGPAGGTWPASGGPAASGDGGGLPGDDGLPGEDGEAHRAGDVDEMPGGDAEGRPDADASAEPAGNGKPAAGAEPAASATPA